MISEGSRRTLLHFRCSRSWRDPRPVNGEPASPNFSTLRGKNGYLQSQCRFSVDHKTGRKIPKSNRAQARALTGLPAPPRRSSLLEKSEHLHPWPLMDREPQKCSVQPPVVLRGCSSSPTLPTPTPPSYPLTHTRALSYPNSFFDPRGIRWAGRAQP